MESLYNRIDAMIDEEINPGLSVHRGFVILAGVEIGTPTRFILEFHGGGAGCPASFTFTLKTIEKHLRDSLEIGDLVVLNAESM